MMTSYPTRFGVLNINWPWAFLMLAAIGLVFMFGVEGLLLGIGVLFAAWVVWAALKLLMSETFWNFILGSIAAVGGTVAIVAFWAVLLYFIGYMVGFCYKSV